MSTVRIPVEVPGATYEVIVGPGLLAEIAGLMKDVSTACEVALVTDETVASHFAVAVDIALAQAGIRVLSLTVPAGESSKSWPVAGEILESMAAQKLGRESVVLALGGGVVGDLAGFAAAVYMRGVGFIQVPTTLLAMVDSSVGGKTGVDLHAGKNLAGAFKQPLLVIADTETLSTLPDAEWRSGLAEVAKSAILSGEEFTGWLEANAVALAARDPQAVADAVERCVRFKAGVVARDEREEGPRECLNYGHTLGHALERVLGYGEVSHGVAVAEGMRFAARVAMQVGEAEAQFALRQDRLLDSLGLTGLEQAAQPRVLLDAMRGDKKARGGAVRMVLSAAPGSWTCERVSDEIVLAHLDAWAASKGGA